jgi:outer membrane protein assembly factor BamB
MDTMIRRAYPTGLVLFVVLALSTLVLAAPVPGAGKGDWPVFRGNAGQTGVAASRIPDKLTVLWTFKTDDAIESAVAVVDGVVYLGSMDEHLYALDLASGRVKWKYKAGPFKAPPAVANGAVYVGDLDGVFHCIGTQKGEKRWTFEAGAEVSGANFFKDSILFASHDETLYCLSKEGKRRWKFRTEGPIYGTPAVVDGKTFLVGCDSRLHVIDVDKGKQVRSVDLGGQTGASAAVVGDLLYVGTMKNEFLAIDWKKGVRSWTYRGRKEFFASAAVTEKLVVAGSRDNRVHAIDRKTGKPVWSHLTRDRVDSSPVIAGTRVVVGSYDRNLYVLDLDSGRERQRVGLDGKISASPVVVGERVLIGTQNGTLYCLGAKK